MPGGAMPPSSPPPSPPATSPSPPLDDDYLLVPSPAPDGETDGDSPSPAPDGETDSLSSALWAPDSETDGGLLSSSPAPSPTASSSTSPAAPSFVRRLVDALTSVEECVTCPQGTFCPVGSARATPCAAGTYSAHAKQSTCAKCETGTYQDMEGQTACMDCERGYFCSLGSATGRPCPGGTYGNQTRLTHADNCTKVQLGFWAPLGSAVPESCGAGFYCPGAGDDTQNDVPGSKPLIQPTGGSTAVQDVVTQELSLDMSCASFDYSKVLQALADQYGVELSLISFEDPCAGPVRQLRARSLSTGITIIVSIAVPPSDESGGSSSVISTNLLQAMSTVTANDLASSIGAALGVVVNVTTTSPLQQQTTLTVACPRGKWCTAGLVVDCDIGKLLNIESTVN